MLDLGIVRVELRDPYFNGPDGRLQQKFDGKLCHRYLGSTGAQESRKLDRLAQDDKFWEKQRPTADGVLFDSEASG